MNTFKIPILKIFTPLVHYLEATIDEDIVTIEELEKLLIENKAKIEADKIVVFIAEEEEIHIPLIPWACIYPEEIKKLLKIVNEKNSLS